MKSTLFLCLFFAAPLHAEDPNTSIESEYSKISTTCFSSRDHELLLGDFIKHGSARLISYTLFGYSAATIGLEELRKALDFGPVRPWTHYKYGEPTKQELESASSLEDYYNLIEPIIQSLDNDFYFEKNVHIAIDYLDKRLPSIRNIFRRRFEEVSKGLKKDRKLVDIMKDEWMATNKKIRRAILEMRRNDDKCVEWNW
ncbi:hypothetical protein CRE_24492 [Caenorhabditis remanei]|uniref:Uncharacterized protein n=1 Tax=Caenorhabditis remanei TaxID=31234 RepID=E3MFX2_CAERE|nr:hypothetical protein CRE_24492 [Caenorhabditis remanei]